MSRMVKQVAFFMSEEDEKVFFSRVFSHPDICILRNCLFKGPDYEEYDKCF